MDCLTGEHPFKFRTGIFGKKFDFFHFLLRILISDLGSIKEQRDLINILSQEKFQ